TSLAPVRLEWFRKASSSVTRGSTCNLRSLPLTFSVIGIVPGPRTFSGLAFSISAAIVSTWAVAATAAEVPKLFKKIRREMEKLLDLVSLISWKKQLHGFSRLAREQMFDGRLGLAPRTGRIIAGRHPAKPPFPALRTLRVWSLPGARRGRP